MTTLASKGAASNHLIVLDSYKGRVGLSARGSLDDRVRWHASHLGVGPLVGKIARMYQNIALGELESGIVGVRYADDPCPSQSR